MVTDKSVKELVTKFLWIVHPEMVEDRTYDDFKGLALYKNLAKVYKDKDIRKMYDKARQCLLRHKLKLLK